MPNPQPTNPDEELREKIIEILDDYGKFMHNDGLNQNRFISSQWMTTKDELFQLFKKYSDSRYQQGRIDEAKVCEKAQRHNVKLKATQKGQK